MKLIKYLVIAVSVATVALINGCNTTGYSEATLTPGQTKQIVKRNSTTDNGYTVIKELRARDEGGILHANVIVQSTSSQDRQIEYQFTWFDKDGFVTGNEMPWHPVSLFAGSAVQLQGVAPNTAAVSYKIRVHIKK